ncbi:MAG: ABC transporter permease, partial [Acidobacteriota bacterium]
VAGRLLPPGSERVAVTLDTGAVRLAERVQAVDGHLHLERLERTDVVPETRVSSVEPVRFALGSDRFGRDVWSRCVWGGRVSLAIGGLAVLLAWSLGLAVGATAALSGGWLDATLMRSVDALLAFPWIFVLIAVASMFSPTTGLLVLVLGASSWMAPSRLARAEIRRWRDRDFVLAARGLGRSEPSIFLHHVLPNAATPLVVDATLRAGSLILAEAALSFLGLGVQPPTASWGNMIAAGRPHLPEAWWLVLFPAAALVATVLGLQLLGDGLRDALDPQRRVAPAAPTESTLHQGPPLESQPAR